jgi:lipopolysaccharide export system protein LptA
MPDKKPDKKKDPNASGGLLSEDEPMHAKAKKMTSTDNNLQVRYEGNAIAWQGNDRLEADVIEIDRDNNIVKAHGHVVSQLLDKADADDPPSKDKDAAAKPKKQKKPGVAPIFTIVKAPDMVYKDDDKLATYTGGVTLDRPNMKVKSDELKAFLRDTDDDSSSLDHAFADGKVDIVQTTLGRTRTGTAEHAEYYVDEAKVILEKGQPQLVDTVKGSTKGMKLTWFSDDDRLLVDGAQGEPAKSKLKRKHAASTKT